jgi:polar amino acid transport system substrate-binding protein
MKLNALFRLFFIGFAALALVACTEQEDAGPGNETVEESAQEDVDAVREKADEPTQEDVDAGSQMAEETAQGDVDAGKRMAEKTAKDCQLTMGWDPWEPYQYRSPKGKVSGLDVDMVNLAAERAGCEISFRQEDFADLLGMIQDGDVDIVAGATRTEERRDYAHFSRSYRPETFSLFVRRADAESVGNPSLKDLLEDGFQIGITEGFLYGEEAEALIANEDYADQFRTARVGELNLFRLIEGDIDALLEDPFVAASIQRRLGLSDDVARVGDDIRTGDVHLMFSRESVDEDIVARFDDALRQLIEDGTRDRILQMYVTE